jgi:hypothetical protein
MEETKRTYGDLTEDIYNYMNQRRTMPWSPAPLDPIESATDDVLILELVKRGYAVAKMPPQQLAENV